MYTAILELITAEWVSGPCEGGHTCELGLIALCDQY